MIQNQQPKVIQSSLIKLNNNNIEEELEKEDVAITALHREEGELEKSEPHSTEERRLRRSVEIKRPTEDASTRPTGVKKPRRTTSQRSIGDESQKPLRATEEHG